MKLRLCCLLFASLVQGGFAAAAQRNGTAPAAPPQLVAALLAKGSAQQQLIDELGESGSKRVRDVLTAWTREEVYLYQPAAGPGIPVLLGDSQDADGKALAHRVDTGAALTDKDGHELRFGSDDLTTVDVDMRLRSRLQQAIDMLTLSDPDPEARRSAILKLGNSQKLAYVPILEKRLAKEPQPELRDAIHEAVALLQLGSSQASDQIRACGELERMQAIGALDDLRRLGARHDLDAPVRNAVRRAIQAIEGHIAVVNFFGTLFRGLSLGSVLLVVALGLAITFGLMGVINMAHGEMIAVGAYTCYIVQNVFGAGFGFAITLPFSFGGKPIAFGFHLPGLNATGWWYQSYFLIALPLAFLAAALVGVVLERCVIRFLYRRPLESLLATWGVSLVLQQLFRMVFGANNVQVNSPNWLLGHFSIHDVSLGYNRVFVIAFAVAIVIGTALLLRKTSLGLLIRAVMQNRTMASCMGVRTDRVNLLTFAFGSGLAGLAGAFLSQIGNVGPSLGQNYIVDSFMVVVVGGVGSIVGTVWAALGMGTADQILQQVLGSPVIGKIIVLIAVILFLQWKPSGLFVTRSRGLEES